MDILGVQINSVRLLCIFFKTKWMNRSIKVLSITAYYFFPSLRQFSNSISKKWLVFGVIQFWSQFSISAKEVNLLHPSVIQWSERTMSGEYGGCGKTSHLSVSKYFFHDMRPSVVMKKNNFIISLLVFRPFFSQCTNESIVADTDRP